MILGEAVSPAAIDDHLYRMVTHSRTTMLPSATSELRAHRATLEPSDADAVMLWWEFQDHTTAASCWLRDLLPSASQLDRAASFLVGSESVERGPVDLRSATGIEPVLVSGGSPDWLYVLDVNHRLIAQWLAHRDLGGVDVDLVIEPRLKEWAYNPTAHKPAWQPQVG